MYKYIFILIIQLYFVNNYFSLSVNFNLRGHSRILNYINAFSIKSLKTLFRL